MSDRDRTPRESSAKKTRRRKTAKSLVELKKEDAEAKLLAALILEVLAGIRTPSDAAAALGVSVPRYYALEVRALEGLLAGCKRRPRGPQRSAEREIEKLQKDMERLERESSRLLALLRAAQRAVGIPREPRRKADPKDGKQRRRRRPTVRALKAAKVLRSEPEDALVVRAEKRDEEPKGRAAL